MNLFPSLTLADRLAFTLEGLARVVAACSDWRRPGGALATWLITLVWRRVRRAEGTLQVLLARFRAGSLRVRVSVPGVRVARGGGRGGAVKGLPQRLGWLLPLVPYQAAGFASQLRAQLDDPEMKELLRASAQARAVLAPVCRMLGIEAQVLTPESDQPEEAAPEVAQGARFAEPPLAGCLERQVPGAPPPGPPPRAGPWDPYWFIHQASRGIMQVD